MRSWRQRDVPAQVVSELLSNYVCGAYSKLYETDGKLTRIGYEGLVHLASTLNRDSNVDSQLSRTLIVFLRSVAATS